MKNKIAYKYGICVICGAILLYVGLNIFCFFDVIYNNVSKPELISIVFPGIFAMVTLCIFKWITEKDFEKINLSQVDENEQENAIEGKNKKENKKKYRYFWIIFLVYILIFLVVGISQIPFLGKVANTFLKYSEEFNYRPFLMKNAIAIQEVGNNKIELFISLLKRLTFSCLPFIFVFFIFYRSFIRKKQSNRKLMKIMTRGIAAIFTFSITILSIYYFVDIPEFKYLYEINEDGVVVNGYSDIRDYYESEYMVIPEQIAGKDVIDIGERNFFYCDELFVSSKFPQNAFERLSGNIHSNANSSKIHMYGEPIDWYEEEGLIYNRDGTEILYINTENLYITEKVNSMLEQQIMYASFLKSIEVSENNETYFAYDNVLYQKVEKTDENGNKVIGTIGWIPPIKENEDIILPLHIYGNKLWMIAVINKTYVVPEGFDKLIEFHDISYGSSEYKVEEGNTAENYKNR